MEVSAVIRGAAKDYTRSISRGLGPSTLKDSIDVESLAAIPIHCHALEPFSIGSASHGRDLLVVACWYMLRELEVASCRWAHIYPEGCSINILLPVQKNDTSGSLTIRSLRCACRIRVHPLCPKHAAERHLRRVRAHACFRSQSDFPLVPTETGHAPTKHVMVRFFRDTIAATGTPITRPNSEGADVERFSGHVLRVSGAQWLARMGMGVHQIQLLGRWSSSAVERYVQMAPLLQVEKMAGELLHPSSSRRVDIGNDDLESETATAQPSEGVPFPPSGQDGPGCDPSKVAEQSAEIQSLRDQVASLKQVILEPEQVLIHRTKSHIVHVGCVAESANNPVHWRTRCGWSYGLTNFYRLASMQTGFRGCRKCFREADFQLASESEGSSGSSADEGSSSSSE